MGEVKTFIKLNIICIVDIEKIYYYTRLYQPLPTTTKTTNKQTTTTTKIPLNISNDLTLYEI
jgi:hypothetical protein